MRTTTRRVLKSEVVARGGTVVYRVEADGFLKQMVRAMVGTLVEVGRGRRKPREVKRILDRKHRSAAGTTAPSRGLFLAEVRY